MQNFSYVLLSQHPRELSRTMHEVIFMCGDPECAHSFAAASRHMQRGTSLKVLKELEGWETLEMVQRYTDLSADHLAQSQWVAPMTQAPDAPKLAVL